MSNKPKYSDVVAGRLSWEESDNCFSPSWPRNDQEENEEKALERTIILSTVWSISAKGTFLMLLNVCKVRLNSDLLAKSLRQILIFGWTNDVY